MSIPTEPTDMASDREIISVRRFPYSCELVFRAWTDPAHLQKWWGPRGFTNTFEEFDLRPGGHWRFVMHGPEAGHYRNEVVFEEISAPARIAWYRLTQPLFRVEATFEERDGQTEVRFRMIFDTPEARRKVIKFVPAANEENFDRLEAELAVMAVS